MSLKLLSSLSFRFIRAIHPLIKNLKGSATWKNVDTISFGDGLLVQLLEGRVTAPTDRPQKKWCSPSFKLQSLPSS